MILETDSEALTMILATFGRFSSFFLFSKILLIFYFFSAKSSSILIFFAVSSVLVSLFIHCYCIETSGREPKDVLKEFRERAKKQGFLSKIFRWKKRSKSSSKKSSSKSGSSSARGTAVDEYKSLKSGLSKDLLTKNSHKNEDDI